MLSNAEGVTEGIMPSQKEMGRITGLSRRTLLRHLDGAVGPKA